ncbi:hypothetical protein PFY12_06320 [Chryseobacterium camelliae]|uniref:DUF8201 domain-containing protein n=1 Tax=Chryseobacterium camelliae TaxID=1265445 RepID=A0ABY7QSD8_9FLAO|nr:hypothetical protein [Chryseobacterium camelliae]WBV61733.1 hypothetical protein PFY12_06320 [Chryseobacterium camelliae]
MISILLSTLLIIPALIGWGKFLENLFNSLFKGISGKIICGILGISLVWTILSFFIPLNIYVEIPTLALGLAYFFKDKLYQEFSIFSKKDSLLISLISFIIIFCGSFYPFILDHFGYYVPTIQWLTEFGLMKGISNLDLTLGQMSIWHIFQAGFSNFSDPFLRINSILLIIYTLYIVEKKSWIHLCFLPVLLVFSQSPSPDLPVIIFSLLILNEILQQNKNVSFIFIYSVFVFAIKPTMIWLPVLSFLYSLFIIKSNLKSLIPGILVLILFFFKNIYTFGYPVFPIAVGNMGISWVPNPEILRNSSQYAIQKTYDMQYSYPAIKQFSTSDYIINWLFLNGIKSAINILFILSLMAFSVFAFIKRNKIIRLICISVLIKSILVISFSAQYRFFIDVFFVIIFVIFIPYFNKKRSIAVFSVFTLFFMSLLSFPNLLKNHLPSFSLGSAMGEFTAAQFYEPSTYEATEFNIFKVGNLKFNISKKYPFNFKTPPPSISEGYIFENKKAGIFPQLIDEKNMKKGFIWKTMNSEEKKEAQNVINSINSSYQQK